MKRIFYRCEHDLTYWTVGKEYEVNGDEGIQFLMDDDGDKRYIDTLNEYGMLCCFTRIERDEPEPQTEWQYLQVPTFEAHGFTWNKHVPGDPMPCDPDAEVVYLNSRDYISAPVRADYLVWEQYSAIIGWRYAEEAKPDLVAISGKVDTVWWDLADGPDLGPVIEIPDVTDHRQMVAMDVAQPESAGEKAYRLKQQAKQEAEAQKEQAKADQMAQAGEVFSREYGSLNYHRLGYRP